MRAPTRPHLATARVWVLYAIGRAARALRLHGLANRAYISSWLAQAPGRPGPWGWRQGEW